MSDGRMMHVLAYLVLISGVTVSALQCPLGCNCGAGDLLLYECGGMTVKARHDGFLEVDCQDQELNCTSLPQINIGHNRSLQRLEVTHCSLASLPLKCAVRASGASGTKSLTLQYALSELKKENVEGLDVETLFMTFTPDGQRSVPMEAIKALPSLRSVRLLSGTDIQLRSHMFLHSPPIEYLEISMSGIKDIPSDAFNGLNRLKILSVWGNSIGTIAVDAFRGVDSLQQLRLNNNPLSSLPPGVFEHTPQLRIVCVENIQLVDLEEGVFTGLLELQEIKLRSGAELTLRPRSLSNLPSLTSLILTSSKVPHLPPDLFLNTTSLVNLTLSYNKIRTLPAEVFATLGALERLVLTRNGIEAVSAEMFTNLASLIELHLDGNKIRELPDQLFSGLSRLKTVSLNNNQIHSIQNFAFLGASALEHLHLSNNQLSWTPEDRESSSPFNMLMDLKTLVLSGNNISCVFSDWRFVLRELRALDLSWNSFTALSQADVQFLQFESNDIVIDFRHNEIHTIQPRASWTTTNSNVKILIDYNPLNCNCHLYDFIVQIKESRKYDVTHATCSQPNEFKNQPLLSIPLSKVTCPIPVNSDCQCLVRPNMQRTECACAELTDVPDLSDSGFINMSLKLSTIPNDFTSLPEYVRILNLTNTSLENVPHVPKSVELLDLTNNNIQIVPKTLFDGLNLTLARNPIVCDCWTTDNIVLLQKYSNRIIDYENVTCSIGTKLTQLDAQSMCNVYKSSVAGVLFAVTIIFMAVIIAVSYKYSIEIQVFLYSRGWCLCLLPKEDIDYDKKYDVFVSFAYEDEKFICEEILPRLEGNYVLHVQDRDWVAGDTIPTEIHRSVAESKRTLIVLSENFLKSIWATEEFRTVHTQASNDKRARAVVILLNMTKKQLDKETKTFLSLSTLIRYGESMFWDKVYYALPRKDMYISDYSGVKEIGRNKALDMWKENSLNVIMNDEGKLVNAGYVKDIV